MHPLPPTVGVAAVELYTTPPPVSAAPPLSVTVAPSVAPDAEMLAAVGLDTVGTVTAAASVLNVPAMIRFVPFATPHVYVVSGCKLFKVWDQLADVVVTPLVSHSNSILLTETARPEMKLPIAMLVSVTDPSTMAVDGPAPYVEEILWMMIFLAVPNPLASVEECVDPVLLQMRKWRVPLSLEPVVSAVALLFSVSHHTVARRNIPPDVLLHIPLPVEAVRVREK